MVVTSTTRISSVVRAFPSPVTLLAAFEASTGFAVVFCSSPTTVGEFHSNFVAHEEPFVVLGDALLGGFLALEFHEAITKLEFNIDNCSNFTEAALQVLFSSVLRKTTDIDLVRLDLFFASIARPSSFSSTRAILVMSDAVPSWMLRVVY